MGTTTLFSKSVNQFTDLICGLLIINKPKIEIKDDLMYNHLAEYDEEDDILFLESGFEDFLDDSDIVQNLCYAVAYGLRQKWQKANDITIFEEYLKEHGIVEDEEFPTAFIEAASFAAFVCEEIFDVEIQFEKLYEPEICDALYIGLSAFYTLYDYVNSFDEEMEDAIRFFDEEDDNEDEDPLFEGMTEVDSDFFGFKNPKIMH